MFEYSRKYKLTFKEDARATGLASVGQMRGHAIKYRKKRIGRIHRNSLHLSKEQGKYVVGFMVMKPNQTVFSWSYFQKTFDKAEEAKEWTKNRFEDILAEFAKKGWTVRETEA